MKTPVILAAVTTLGLLSFQCAWAQNTQSWLNNTENKILQDTGAGAINNQQAGYLQNRAAQIQQQHPHHHHHQGQWNNGQQGFFNPNNPNWNGTTNGGNRQYWSH